MSTRKRGRPARLSRAEIIQAALQSLSRHPDEALSMQGLARHLGVAPMTLYGHVENREDLLKAIADHVLGSVPAVPDDLSWEEAIRLWAVNLRAVFQRYPFVTALLNEGMGTPAAWIAVSQPLLRALHDAGLRGADLADAQRWISRVVIGHILMESMLPSAVSQEWQQAQSTLQAMSAEDQGLWREILPALGGRDDQAVFEYSLERCIEAIRGLI